MNMIDKKIHSQKIIFLGESIHGISEFTEFKSQFIKKYCNIDWICIFEADSLGMDLSRSQHENPKEILKNFPAVMRTQGMLELVSWLTENNIQYYGIDSIPRRLFDDYPTVWIENKKKQDLTYQEHHKSKNYYEWRENSMVINLHNIINKNQDKKLLVMLHNMHIKNRGSKEKDNLKLRSVKERLDVNIRKNSISIAQLALSGNALHNNLTPFSFNIADIHSVELLVVGKKENCSIYPTSKLSHNLVAWHHAFEKENIAVKKQYELLVIFNSASVPKLIK